MSDDPTRDETRLIEITFAEADGRAPVSDRPELEYERDAALHDLLEENLFRPRDLLSGPYRLRLKPEDDRLVFEVSRTQEASGEIRLPLSLAPFRRLIKDYFLVCESYYDAIKSAPLSRVEELDKSRRSLHDEGSSLLRERLAGRVEMDFGTARRLFTLICVLHRKA